MTATDLPEFNVTLKMARSTGSLADEVEHRTFTVRGPARNAKHAEAIAFGLGHGINEASGYAWKFCGGADGVTVAPAADEQANADVAAMRNELNRMYAADMNKLLAELDRVRTNRDQVADSLSAVWDALGLKTASDGNAVDAIRKLLAELDRVRADLAAAHNHAHHTDTEIQRLTRDGIAYANENARLRHTLFDVAKASGKTHVWDHEKTDWVPITEFAATQAGVAR